MDQSVLTELEPPRFEDGRALSIVGLSERYSAESSANIPAQWERFGPYIGKILGQVDRATYGVCYNGDGHGNLDYLCGVEVTEGEPLP